jgi:hypothetical protein
MYLLDAFLPLLPEKIELIDYSRWRWFCEFTTANEQ